nr:PRAME family member 12-like [Camelus bactrianus]
MTNVQRLRVSVSEEQELQRVVQFTSQILRLHHLWDPHLESPFSLEGRLDQMFRCLMTPLDSLAITHCFLEESDLTHLSWCPNISQLKGLDLSGVSLTDFSPEPLQVLLEKVAATLQELNLNQYGIMDPQLESVLPALSRCSQLRSFSLCGSPLSTAVMGKLPSHTAGLPRLSQEGYPAPRETYSCAGVPLRERLARLQAELLEILRDLGRPRTIWLNSIPWAPGGYREFSLIEIIEHPHLVGCICQKVSSGCLETEI